MSECSDCPNLSCAITDPSIKACCHAQLAEKTKKALKRK